MRSDDAKLLDEIEALLPDPDDIHEVSVTLRGDALPRLLSLARDGLRWREMMRQLNPPIERDAEEQRGPTTEDTSQGI